MSVLARLASDVSPEEAGVALATVQGGLDGIRSEDERVARVDVVPLSGRPEGNARIALTLLQSAVLALLLITATNAGGLLLTRAVERRQEIAIRTSLGASRMRIARQLFVESGLLSIAAALLALIISASALAALREQLRARFGAKIMGWERLGLDWQTTGYALVLATGLAVALAVLPALRVLRGDLAAHLRQAAPAATTA